MKIDEHYEIHRHVRPALQRLREAAIVPPPDQAHEAALMAAFDVAHITARPVRRYYWWMAGLAAAAAVLVAVASNAPSRDVQPEPPSGFVIVPGAATLPRLESGTLVRMDLPVSVLPSLGVTPPAGSRTAVAADVIVAQDGLPRAVRLVN